LNQRRADIGLHLDEIVTTRGVDQIAQELSPISKIRFVQQHQLIAIVTVVASTDKRARTGRVNIHILDYDPGHSTSNVILVKVYSVSANVAAFDPAIVT
jgi:hypothetical protein